MNAETIAVSASGLAWTITYFSLVYRGFKDKSYGMPLIPLSLNFAWEFVFSVIYPPENSDISGVVINGIWMVCDIGIIFTYFLYGYRYFERYYFLGRKEWIIFSLFAFIVSFGIMLLGGPFFGQFETYFFGDVFQGAIFIAYIQNLIISVCFILMLWQRKSSVGQSLYIALTKCIGTGLTVGIYHLFFLHKGEASLMNLIIGVTFMLDIYYIYSIYKVLRHEGNNPWRRF